MKDKELRKALAEIGIIQSPESAYYEYSTKSIFDCLTKNINKINEAANYKHEAQRKIDRLERKLAAVMELLNIKELPREEKNIRLKKGNKEVDIKPKKTTSNGVNPLGFLGQI